MKPRCQQQPSRSAAALVIVMVLVLAMAVMAGAFAYAMKVETRLATNTRSSPELEWLGRSGIEIAKWILEQQRRIPGEGAYDSLNQFWANGIGNPDLYEDPFIGLDLQHIPIGNGSIRIEITDCDRRLNLNTTPEPLLELALQTLGAGAGEASSIAAAIADWRDRDDLENVRGGAEKPYYLGLNPPYAPKDGPFDDVSELLLVRGITPQLYWGDHQRNAQTQRQRSRSNQPDPSVAGDTGIGLSEVFTAISSGRINVNTAPESVLRVVFGGDTGMPAQILQRRAGPDGIDGTSDDQPFRSPAELLTAGMNAGNLFSTQSTTFEARIEATIGGSRKSYIGVIRRGAGRDSTIMLFHPL